MLLRNTAGILGVMLVTHLAPLSVSELLGNADRFNRQPVTVSGTMSNYRGTPFRRGGSMYTFDLTDSAETVHVITFAKPPCVSGTVTFEGTFEQVKRRVKVSYSSDEITAWTVTCLPDIVDPRWPKGK